LPTVLEGMDQGGADRNGLPDRLPSRSEASVIRPVVEETPQGEFGGACCKCDAGEGPNKDEPANARRGPSAG
jgi:hypothetical protein